ncbi:MAG: hypothetical protein R6V85_04985 [Polyangia bacterium]
MSRTFELVFRFSDDPEDSNVVLVSKDDEYHEVLGSRKALLNAARDLYIVMLEELAAAEEEEYDDPRLCLYDDRINLVKRSLTLDRRQVVVCPESFLPQEGEMMQ